MPPNRIVCLAADPSSMSADCAAIKPCATWIFSNSIFEELRKAYNADIQKEIRLPDVVNSLVAKNTVKAIPLQNGVVRYNINTWEDYFNVLQNAGIQSRNPFVG
jgi:UTP-glucose-1-phosphate uridylyltransferase